jgi:DNA-3-methyladenine glycosylase
MCQYYLFYSKIILNIGKNLTKVFIPNFNDSLKKEFYINDTPEVAKNLIGKVLVKKINEDTIAGIITETEAYLSKDDLSSHSSHGLTTRNAAMFEDGGILYVYKIYGVHHCINFVTETKSIGCAVLVRALEPLIGIEFMIKNRGINNIKKLCSGPGNLSKAFNFTINNNFESLLSPELFIQNYNSIRMEDIGISTRIGINKSKDLPLRFYLKNSEFISIKLF